MTCGGARLNEIDPGPMQSKIVPHLFFAGEALDVDRIAGGFNFQHGCTGGWIEADRQLRQVMKIGKAFSPDNMSLKLVCGRNGELYFYCIN